MTEQPQELAIRDEMIRLGQALKLANLAEDGHQAKELIAEGRVIVNGQEELRRGAQLRHGDEVEVLGTEGPRVRVVSSAAQSATEV